MTPDQAEQIRAWAQHLATLEGEQARARHNLSASLRAAILTGATWRQVAAAGNLNVGTAHRYVRTYCHETGETWPESVHPSRHNDIRVPPPKRMPWQAKK